MYTTPHRSSAMAMFGFVYLWYLTVVLLLEIWLEYRSDIVRLAENSKGFLRPVYRALTLGSMNVSPDALRMDDKVGYAVTVIGIPSAFLLHGYVGFIFGPISWLVSRTFAMSLRFVLILPPGSNFRSSISGALASRTVLPASPPRIALYTSSGSTPALVAITNASETAAIFN